MGDSEKVEGSNPARYGFLEHRRFLEALLGRLDVTENVVVVGHDWGGALAIDWARRHPESIRCICYFDGTRRTQTGRHPCRGCRASWGVDAGEEVRFALDSPLEGVWIRTIGTRKIF